MRQRALQYLTSCKKDLIGTDQTVVLAQIYIRNLQLLSRRMSWNKTLSTFQIATRNFNDNTSYFKGSVTIHKKILKLFLTPCPLNVYFRKIHTHKKQNQRKNIAISVYIQISIFSRISVILAKILNILTYSKLLQFNFFGYNFCILEKV